MDGMLSQDEINALLSGMDIGENGGFNSTPPEAAAPAADSSAAAQPETTSAGQPHSEAVDAADADLTDIEKDAIGEVANISMGSSATTLYSLVNGKVSITTPVVSLAH